MMGKQSEVQAFAELETAKCQHALTLLAQLVSILINQPTEP